MPGKNRSLVAPALLVFVCSLVLFGCGGSESDTTNDGQPSATENASADKPLKERLLEMVRERREQMLSGDREAAHEHTLPEVRAEDVFFRKLTDRWPPEPVTDKQKQMLREIEPFGQDTPIRFERSGDWARLVQDIDDEHVWCAYFHRRDGQWWIAQVSRSGRYDPDGRFRHLQAEHYWPDRIASFFLLPSIEIAVEPADPPEGDSVGSFAWITVAVTNTSEQTIPAATMAYRFTNVKYITGDSQSSSEPRGGGGLGALQPGETRELGKMRVIMPDADADADADEAEVVVYCGVYAAPPIPAEKLR